MPKQVLGVGPFLLVNNTHNIQQAIKTMFFLIGVSLKILCFVVPLVKVFNFRRIFLLLFRFVPISRITDIFMFSNSKASKKRGKMPSKQPFLRILSKRFRSPNIDEEAEFRKKPSSRSQLDDIIWKYNIKIRISAVKNSVCFAQNKFLIFLYISREKTTQRNQFDRGSFFENRMYAFFEEIENHLFYKTSTSELQKNLKYQREPCYYGQNPHNKNVPKSTRKPG